VLAGFLLIFRLVQFLVPVSLQPGERGEPWPAEGRIFLG
jgi:hypothetical protein